MDRDEEQSEQEIEDDASRQRRIRFEAEKLGESMFSKETRDHLVKATAEIILAVDSMIPRDKIPEDVKQHYLAAKRESLLLVGPCWNPRSAWFGTSRARSSRRSPGCVRSSWTEVTRLALARRCRGTPRTGATPGQRPSQSASDRMKSSRSSRSSRRRTPAP